MGVLGADAVEFKECRAAADLVGHDEQSRESFANFRLSRGRCHQGQGIDGLPRELVPGPRMGGM